MVLSIAGSDCSAGAGIQADLKTMTALGLYGTTAVTCVVAERPGRVMSITPLPPAQVAEQIRLVAEAFPIAAVKTGMLYSKAIIEAVEIALRPLLAAGIPLVVDPVMVASTGDALMNKSALGALEKLIARATLVTPNRDEAETFLGRMISTLREQKAAARELAEKFGGPAVLVKGGHLRGTMAVDVLATASGGKAAYFRAPRIAGVDPHGTGCTYSAAITAGLGKGLSMEGAIRNAKKFMTRAIRGHEVISGHALLRHDS